MKINTTKIKMVKIPEEMTKFQTNLIPSPRCGGCESNCTVLYDRHHDEYFSINCGTVIMEQGQYIIPYTIDYTYNTTSTITKHEKKR